jgi:para-nitrobenzyl esterase
LRHRLLSQVLVSSILLGCLSLHAAETRPVVKVTGGEIVGRSWQDVKGATFRGVPFAAPPVGELRWRDPAPVKPWTGQRDTIEYGAPCAQVDGGWNSRDARDGKEDCLYLNVDTPDVKPAKPMPVMVWIHGGANAGGSARGGDVLENPLAQHGVVVVSIQYRLGYFGFLSHPELSKESGRGASGNYALLDQIAALKWVRDNIAKFGGDAKQVTIFGQSAGAYDITLLMTSPLAKGLFARAIEQSGPALAGRRKLIPLAEAELKGRNIAEKLQAPAQAALAFMRKLTTEDVLKASPPYGQGGLMAIVDGYVLPADPAEVYAKHQEHRVPLIIGSNSREFPFFGNPANLKPAIAEFFGSSAGTVLDAYGLSEKPGPQVAGYGTAGEQFSTDELFRCHAVAIADEHSELAATYQYEYSHTLAGREPGARHSDELGYVFGTFFMAPPNEVDRKVSAAMQGYWTNFAKTGDPNGGALPKWPAHDAKSRAYVELASDGPQAKTNLRGDICPLYEAAVAQQKVAGE